MKTKLLSLLATLCMAMALTSCLGDNDDNTQMLRGHFTIEGAYPTYTLYHRAGYIIKLNPTSVTEVLGASGFGNHHRGFFDIYYTQADVAEDPATHQVTISNARLGSGSYVNTYEPLTFAEAAESKLSVADSVFAISQWGDIWAHRGYLNIAITAPYSIANSRGVYPTMNVAFEPEAIADDALTLTLLYNRHTAKDVQTGTESFVAAYPISNLLPLVPGNDSVRVTINAEGVSPKTIKVGRR